MKAVQHEALGQHDVDNNESVSCSVRVSYKQLMGSNITVTSDENWGYLPGATLRKLKQNI